VITTSAPPLNAWSHRLGAEIGIGRQQPVAELLDGAIELHDRQIAFLAGVEHIVAEDSGDLQPRQPQRSCDLAGVARRADGIGGAHIRDDLDALGGAHRQHRAHPFLQQRIEPAVGILHARLLRQRHGALAEAFEHQILDVTLFGEFERGLDAVPRISRAGSDPDGAHYFSPK
jgi:hypothetical protein